MSEQSNCGHTMNLIENYLLKQEYFGKDYDKKSQEDKLQFFYGLFTSLQDKYNCNVDSIKQLELEHKEELSQVFFYIFYNW